MVGGRGPYAPPRHWDDGKTEEGVPQLAWREGHAYRIAHRNVTTIATNHARVQPLVARFFVLHVVQPGRLLRFDDRLVAPNGYLQRLACTDNLLRPTSPWQRSGKAGFSCTASISKRHLQTRHATQCWRRMPICRATFSSPRSGQSTTKNLENLYG